MSIKVHLLCAIIISIILYPLIKFKILYFIIGAVLIDVDHYLYYIVRHKKFNLILAHRYWIKHVKTFAKESVLIFHTVEFIAVMVILSFFYFEILIITLGILVHSALDVYYEFFMTNTHKNYSLFNYIRKRIS